MGTLSNPRKSERGQVLLFVVILLVLSAIILPPLLNYTFASHRTISIRQERMQLLYAADSGIEDALHWILNPGNLTKTGEGESIVSFPAEYNSAAPYFLHDRNESDVKIDLVNAGNGSYIITSTAKNNINGTETKIKVRALKGNVTVPMPPEIVPAEGNASTSPFDYAMASLGNAPSDIGGKSEIEGDIYSGGPMNIYADTVINGRAYADGTMDVGAGGVILRSAHANGDIILEKGAEIWGNAYAEGDITLLFGAAIRGSAYSKGAVMLNKEGEIGGNAWAYGDITIYDPQKSQLTTIWGNVSSNEDVIANGGLVAGNAASHYTVTEINGGSVVGSIVQGVPTFIITLPSMPKLVIPDVEYWRDYYYDEAHGNNTHPSPSYEYSGTYEVKKSASLGPKHISGDLNIVNKATLTLSGVVYVDGNVNIDNGCIILGEGKIIAEHDINLWNNDVGSESGLILFMSVYGNIIDKNNSDINAVLYAPNGEITVGVDSNVSGSIVGDSTDLKNMVTATYDEQVHNIPGLPGGNATVPVPTTTTQPVPPGLEFEGIRIISYIVLE